MKKLFQLSFLPRSVDFAILVLRLWFGVSMLVLHGWSKLMNFSAMKTKLPDLLHLGATANMASIVLCEVVCSVLLIVGFGTRIAALLLAFEMAVAFFLAHGAKLSGPGSGELAFLYLGPALVLFFAGSGKFAVDGA